MKTSEGEVAGIDRNRWPESPEYALIPATREQHVEAANISNVCRKAGVSAATIDCLIAAQCILLNGELLTLDDDFKRISGCCGLRIYPIPVD